MCDIDVYNDLKELCYKYHLGVIADKPIAVQGGLMHKMYKVIADAKVYAIKWLNPSIMSRDGVMENMINSERIAKAFSDYLPVVAAMDFDGQAVLQLNGKCYMVFPWVDGVSIYPPAISTGNCYEIGNALGKMHYLNLSIPEMKKGKGEEPVLHNWKYYQELGLEQQVSWIVTYTGIMDELYHYNKLAKEASRKLSEYMVLSHKDLDPKNVMWHDEKPYLIDLEAAGYVNPYQELLEVLNYWSDDGMGGLDKDKFMTLLLAYQENMSTLSADWDLVLDSGYTGMLDWLEYSLKRALGLEGLEGSEGLKEEERQRGVKQIMGTIEAVKKYENQKKTIRKWLNE